MNKQLEAAIKIAADNISKLRAYDVFRVLEQNERSLRQSLVDFISRERPDLADEAAECLAELA